MPRRALLLVLSLPAWCPAASAPHDSTLSQARRALAEGDVDGDGMLSGAEFEALAAMGNQGLLNAAFEALDRDGDGKLDSEPFEPAHLERSGEDDALAEIKRLLKDKNLLVKSGMPQTFFAPSEEGGAWVGKNEALTANPEDPYKGWQPATDKFMISQSFSLLPSGVFTEYAPYEEGQQGLHKVGHVVLLADATLCEVIGVAPSMELPPPDGEVFSGSGGVPGEARYSSMNNGKGKNWVDWFEKKLAGHRADTKGTSWQVRGKDAGTQKSADLLGWLRPNLKFEDKDKYNSEVPPDAILGIGILHAVRDEADKKDPEGKPAGSPYETTEDIETRETEQKDGWVDALANVAKLGTSKLPKVFVRMPVTSIESLAKDWACMGAPGQTRRASLPADDDPNGSKWKVVGSVDKDAMKSKGSAVGAKKSRKKCTTDKSGECKCSIM